MGYYGVRITFSNCIYYDFKSTNVAREVLLHERKNIIFIMKASQNGQKSS